MTEAVRRRPYSVILLDEIEKAHDDVYNILLQILDDGRLTDNHGHTVDFTNTIIVMTSNIGSQVIQKITDEGGSNEEIRAAVDESVKARFAPEFFNRIDEKIVFSSPSREEIRKIVDLQIEQLATTREKEIQMDVTDAARNAIAVPGYDPLRCSSVEAGDPDAAGRSVGHHVLRSNYQAGDTVTIDYQDGEFQMS